jgi:hypothetical protein
LKVIQLIQHELAKLITHGAIIEQEIRIEKTESSGSRVRGGMHLVESSSEDPLGDRMHADGWKGYIE